MSHGPDKGTRKMAPVDRFEDLSTDDLEALAQDYAIFAATGALTRRTARILGNRPIYRDQPVIGANLF